jgi:holo-[acyl-carrier protein] synthase
MTLGKNNNMMNLDNISIGVDIERISRFKDLNITGNSTFLNKIFTKKEMDYCFSKKAPAQHLAVRFAAKEAIIKAIDPLDKKISHLNKIEITQNINGAPLVNLKGYIIKISLSHCGDQAIAFVILKKIK